MLVTDPKNRISSKELYDLMMKSYFDIKEDSSKGSYCFIQIILIKID